MKKLSDIALHLTDEEYYNDNTMHHSTISSFDKGGFDCLSSLKEHKESPSLLLGSIVDTLITEPEMFDKKFFIAEIPSIPDSIISIVKDMYNELHEVHKTIYSICDVEMLSYINKYAYQPRWKAETRCNKVREEGASYYNQLGLAEGKTMVFQEMYDKANNMVNALKTSLNTKFFYQEDTPFENIERVYQPIFRETIDGITYTIKPDELVVDHNKKLIIATDLKTTGKPEYKFAQSFIDWGYSHQSRLYYKVLRQALDKDDYFKDFRITNWFFIVVNKDNLCPIVWEDVDTKTEGTLIYGKNNQIEIRSPFEIAKELKEYLDNNYKVPIGIYLNKSNDLKTQLNKL